MRLQVGGNIGDKRGGMWWSIKLAQAHAWRWRRRPSSRHLRFAPQGSPLLDDPGVELEVREVSERREDNKMADTFQQDTRNDEAGIATDANKM